MSDASVVQPLMKQFNVPGVSIAVIKDFKVVATYTYGVADVETGAPVTPETMFQAASISKPVFAMASSRPRRTAGSRSTRTSTRTSSRGRCLHGLNRRSRSRRDP